MTSPTFGETYMWYLPEQAGNSTHLDRCGTVMEIDGDWFLVMTFTTNKIHAKGMNGDGNVYPGKTNGVNGPGGRNEEGYACPHDLGWVHITRIGIYRGFMNDYWQNRLWEDHDTYFGNKVPTYKNYNPLTR